MADTDAAAGHVRSRAQSSGSSAAAAAAASAAAGLSATADEGVRAGEHPLTKPVLAGCAELATEGPGRSSRMSSCDTHSSSITSPSLLQCGAV